MPSRAETFFALIRDSHEPAVAIRKLVTDHVSEQEYLEFKSGDKLDDKALKKYWSELLSAFANTEGGVVIFGIKTGSTTLIDAGPANDVAVGIDLFENPEQWAQRLRDMLLNATVEPVNGVDIISVIESDGEGFVVCLIPEGRHKPYRAMTSDPKHAYFQRVDDNCVVISHAMLRTMFYPQLKCSLSLEVSVHWMNESMLALNASIKNTGQATLSSPSLLVEWNTKTDYNGQTGRFYLAPNSVRSKPGFSSARYSTREPFHPGEHVPAFTLTKYFFGPDNERRDAMRPFEIYVTAYMNDQLPVYFHFDIDKANLKQDNIIPAIQIDGMK